ncbi:ABC transporter permease [Leifsonia xyli subsp. cynodontis DSM 46306]|uniref:ABC transmembrane type-1 domain-containing protein n=1 Tax=Leifsonia xyli subsp. cynodontis DSM 46306 TaxID=1389489 RepID=U3PEQ8_LEIXC|nr:carbohydrate ABC transporter permease [Leifsonia xyli]AGW42103.1 ABC transporter permease [Leifsonia xyli subsp. cynodontis DSM 46306]
MTTTRRGQRTRRVGAVIRFTVVIAAAGLVFLPVYVSMLSAFTQGGTIARNGLIPSLGEVILDNFRQAIDAVPLLPEYLVSIAVVTVQTLGNLITGSLAAYALVFPTWPGRRIAFALVLLTLAIPGEALVIPNYEFVSGLGLRDTIIGVVLPYLAMGYPIFLLRQAFSAVPTELWEAARLDGAGHLRTLFTIIVPACRPQVTTAIVWSALAAWNGFFWPLLITDSAVARTIQVGVSQLAASEASEPSVIFAGAVLVVLPTVALVIVAQRFLVNGLARGGVLLRDVG